MPGIGLSTARSVFAHVGGWDLPGGYLLVCSEQPLAAKPEDLAARLKGNVWVQTDDMDLEDALPALRWDDMDSLPPEAARLSPDTDDRPSGFYPLPDLARRVDLIYNAAETAAK